MIGSSRQVRRYSDQFQFHKFARVIRDARSAVTRIPVAAVIVVGKSAYNSIRADENPDDDQDSEGDQNYSQDHGV
jgi:hypothetical protein